ncbi:hypothetical protein F5Y06DRAFT_308274 [Hypoxylon sp. FL0890]|nr:hypothetical protein F5Y06DRAFT_308274 [Hypoxylon sp. FL0890]
MSSPMDHCSTIDSSRYFDIPSVSDITGIGVLIGFIFPAYILLFLVCVYYIFIYDPTLDPYRGRGKEDQQKRSPGPNLFDQLLLRLVRKNFLSAIINRFFKAFFRPTRKVLPIKAGEFSSQAVSGTWQDAFNKYVVGMADTQVITGLAILLGGYLARSDLSAFHWKMIVYLAWLSCSTHLSALVFLRNYLLNRPFERFCRLFSTLALLLCLTVAMIPTGHFYWDGLIYEPIDPSSDITAEIDAPPSGNATCYFNVDFKPEAYKAKYAMVTAILLLVLSFITKTFKLSRRFLWFDVRFTTHYMVDMVLRSAAFFQKLFGTATLQGRIASNMVVAAHMTVCVWIDLYASMASDVYWLIISLTWGTMKIVQLRSLLSHAENQDDTWSFGQLLPVFLLALPMINLIEHFRKFVFQDIDKLQDQESSDLQFEEKTNSSDEHSSSPSSEADSMWILRPELFDEYYKNSIWMCWVVMICLGHTFTMTTLLLQPDISLWDKQLGRYVAADTISMAEVLALWFVFVQGAMVHIAILVLSLVEVKLPLDKMKLPFVGMKWNRRLIIHTVAALISQGLMSTAVYTASRTIDLAAETDLWSFGVQGFSLYYFIGTLSLSGVAIIVWLLSVYLPGRRISRETESDETV